MAQAAGNPEGKPGEAGDLLLEASADTAHTDDGMNLKEMLGGTKSKQGPQEWSLPVKFIIK